MVVSAGMAHITGFIINELLAKYQFGAIHTADITDDKVTNRALCSAESEAFYFIRSVYVTSQLRDFYASFVTLKLTPTVIGIFTTAAVIYTCTQYSCNTKPSLHIFWCAQFTYSFIKLMDALWLRYEHP